MNHTLSQLNLVLATHAAVSHPLNFFRPDPTCRTCQLYQDMIDAKLEQQDDSDE